MSVRCIIRGLVLGLMILGAGSVAADAASARPQQYTQARVVRDTADTGGPLDVLSMSLRQVGRDLVIAVATRKKWKSRSLAGRGQGTLCLLLERGAQPLRVCLTGSATSVSLTRAGGKKRHRSKRAIPAVVAYSKRYARARVALSDVGFFKGKLTWQVRTKWADGKRCPRARDCTDTAPDTDSAAFRVKAVSARGCQMPKAGYVTSGPRSRRMVALTFDDGPGPYTSRVLSVLKRTHVPATFFVLGGQINPNRELLRREIAAGHVVANHTWSHANVSGGGGFAARQIASTTRAIRRATGFTPCLFRAPYGAVSGGLVGVARAQSLATIEWDVDPRDWSTPGAGAIEGRVVGAARPGSIVVMHDGGGPRGQTVAALPGLIAKLRARGYGFATVPELLGGSVIYRP